MTLALTRAHSRRKLQSGLHPGDRNVATKVLAVLEQKGHKVITVEPHYTVASLVRVLTVNRTGAVPVINEEGRPVGIISERDVIHGMAQHGDVVRALPAENVMLSKSQLPELLLYGMMSAAVLAALAYSLPRVPVES